MVGRVRRHLIRRRVDEERHDAADSVAGRIGDGG
jgi:hypothetical protein